MDIDKVGDLIIEPNYGRSVLLGTNQLDDGLTLEVTKSFRMDSGYFGVSNSLIPYSANLLLTGNSTFSWQEGWINRVNIQLGSTSNHGVTGKIVASDVVRLDNSSLNNHGTFTWVSGDIRVGEGLSYINNHVGATFEVQNGKAYASYVGFESVGKVTNNGLFKFTGTGETTFQADFLNDSGTVQVGAGTVRFYKKAEQIGAGSTFQISNGTVDVSLGSDVLEIHDGSIIGNGKIEGNLTLGYDPAVGPPPQTTAVINPGFTTFDETGIIYTPGTITITQSFEMFSSGAVMQIDVTASGGYDKVAVSYWARLSGALRLNPSPDYKPVSGTRLDFLTSGGFEGTDFAEKTSTYWGSWAEPGTNKPVKWKLDKTANTYFLLAELIQGSGPPG